MQLVGISDKADMNRPWFHTGVDAAVAEIDAPGIIGKTGK